MSDTSTLARLSAPLFVLAFVLVAGAGCTPPCEGAGCPCAGDVDCDDNQTCRAGTCLADIPTLGETGGPCGGPNLCAAGNSCIESVCVACDGTVGCACDAETTCTDGLTCVAGVCEDVPDVAPPADPRCYAPCTESFADADGNWVVCDADGLFAGCREGTSCVDGRCIADGEDPDAEDAAGTCDDDTGCPSWQVCIEGRCYSDCESDLDCARWPGDARACHMHACRVPCTAEDNACGAATFCDAENGATGFCMPSEVGTNVPVTQADVFTVSTLRIDFHPGLTESTFTIENRDPQDRTYIIRRAAGPQGQSATLDWVTINGSSDAEVLVEVTAGDSATVTVGDVETTLYDTWTGSLQIGTEDGQQQSISLVYLGNPSGRWVGKMTYFANFPSENLAAWAADPEGVDSSSLDNAFLIRWQAFLSGQMSLDELKALILSTTTESWRNPRMLEYCPDPQTVCYPYDNTNGFSVYTTSVEAFGVPTGAAEMPMVMNLKQDAGDPTLMSGRVDSGKALHFPANPAVSLAFEQDPLTCDVTARGTLLCRIDALSTQALVGGRFLSGQGGDCELNAASGSSEYELVQTPWLLPGLKNNTAFDAESGLVYRYECRDPLLPNGQGGAPNAEEQALNLSLSQANPIPDGRTRVRTLELIDGVMVDGQTMLVLFKETFDSYLGIGMGDTFSSYGVIRLDKTAADLADQDYVGNVQSEDRDLTTGLALPTCDETLLADLQEISDSPTAYDPADPADAATIATLIVSGRAEEPGPGDVVDDEHIHWYCADTGLIDGGEFGETPCPATSDVVFFAVETASLAPEDVQSAACNVSAGISVTPKTDLEYRRCQPSSPNCNCAETPSDCLPCDEADPDTGCFAVVNDTLTDVYDVDIPAPAACADQLDAWDADPNVGFRRNPTWGCAATTGGTPSSCTVAVDQTGLPIVDRRANKVFYKAGVTSVVAPGLRDLVIEAFRYKTQFRSRTGGAVGFAPETCAPGVSYCYEPDTIEDIGRRFDCLVDVYDRHVDSAFDGNSDVKNAIQTLLQQSFAQEEIRLTQPTDGTDPELLPFPIVNEGYERLFAELMIMLGDEALTASFASRFDLAGANQLGFEGSLFEPGGLDLAGGAGFEMHKLYQSVQYYQVALDRFYRLSPYVWKSVQTYGSAIEDGYVDETTVTAWLERLIRASTQKARAQAEIASRYEDFNEPALARNIIERAYTSTYIESVVLSRTMLELLDSVAVSGAAKPQLQRTLETAQLTYKSALLRMQEAYDQVSDNRTLFGFAPEYIPFPALNPASSSEDNAFEVILASTRQKLSVAAEKEDLALAQNRAYNVDAAAFQNELLSIENNYENQLADICGTFTALDGGVYPSIIRYAHLIPGEAHAGDPCGGGNNGEISQALIDLQSTTLDLLSARQSLVDFDVRQQIIEDRVRSECQLINDIADFQFDTASDVNAWQQAISNKEQAIGLLDTVYTQTINSTKIATGPNPIASAVGAIAVTAVGVATTIGTTILRDKIQSLESTIALREAAAARWVTAQDCSFALIDANAQTRELLLDGYHLEIEANQAMLAAQAAAARVDGLLQEAAAVQAEMDEAQQLAINLEAARNDPNVRIYKNDAVRTADRTFERALREAYRLTKVYEYYTSQSYAYLGDLFLVRLISRGDFSLEAYVDDLEDAFAVFEEIYGRPDERVLVLSARDDLVEVPRLDAQNQALSIEARNAAFREALSDPARVDENGHIRVSFPITLTALSPLTNNHKVSRVEVEILGEDADDVARVYLRQEGTGVVRGVDGEKVFFTFPERTAVVNAFFNGEKVFDRGVYRNDRLRDRPLANTAWSLLLNLRDESDNLDIDASSLSDIRLYIYYTDFTAL